MRGAKYILALTLAMAGASALAYNNGGGSGYENHYPTNDIAGYAGYGNDDITGDCPFPNAARNQVFAQCKVLTAIDLADQNVEEVGNASFAYCGVPKLTIPSCVHSVGYISFGGCSNLTEVSCDSWNWANGTANIEDKEPFRDCFNLKTIKVSGDAAEPPTSFDVTVIFTELTTVYCPESKVSLWQAAYQSLTIIGDGNLLSLAPGSGYGLMNGTRSEVFSAANQSDANAYASTIGVRLTAEDQLAKLNPSNLRVFAAAAPGGSGYVAVVDVNPATVPAPIIGSIGSSAMTVDQGNDGVQVGISILNAVQGLWYGCEVKDSMSDAFVNDVDSFIRAPKDGTLTIPCTKRASEAAFFRVKVAASKPTE